MRSPSTVAPRASRRPGNPRVPGRSGPAGSRVPVRAPRSGKDGRMERAPGDQATGRTAPGSWPSRGGPVRWRPPGGGPAGEPQPSRRPLRTAGPVHRRAGRQPRPRRHRHQRGRRTGRHQRLGRRRRHQRPDRAGRHQRGHRPGRHQRPRPEGRPRCRRQPDGRRFTGGKDRARIDHRQVHHRSPDRGARRRSEPRGRVGRLFRPVDQPVPPTQGRHPADRSAAPRRSAGSAGAFARRAHTGASLMAPVQPPPVEQTVGRQGNYAGVVSRAVAFGVDVAAVWGLYTLGVYAVSLGTQLLFGKPLNVSKHQLAALIVVVIWGFFYFAYQWTLGGRTLGMALFGLQVVGADGSPVTGRQAVIRTLALPLSFLILPLALLMILIQRERRPLHDLIGGTAVVYAWDARAARLRWLAQKEPLPRTKTPELPAS